MAEDGVRQHKNGDGVREHKNGESRQTAADKIDLANFVLEVDRFSRFIEPFALLLFSIDDIRRWRYPIITASLWLLFNIGCLLLTKGAVFTLVAFAVICLSGVSLFHIHTRILDKFLPRTERETCEYTTDDVSTLQTVREFRFSLAQVYDFIEKCNEYMAHLYQLLKWDLTIPALRFHIEVCTFFLILVVFPTRWICILFTNWFFLGSDDIVMNMYGRGNSLLKTYTGKSLPDIKLIDEMVDEQEEMKQKELQGNNVDQREEFAIVDGEEVQISADRSNQPKQGMVSKFIETRRRKQVLANESCFACDTTFSSFLKRRYYCRHCGNNFCSKCCNQKVPRSLFGATAPAAQTETVLVCNVCHKLLISEEDKDQTSTKDKDT